MRVIHAQVQPGTTGRTLTARLKLLQPTTPDLVDAGFLLAACLLALAGFVTGFDDLRFLLVAAIGLVVGVFAGHVANVFRWSWAVAVAFAGVAYFLLGGPLAVPRLALAGFLPTPASMGSLARSLVTGWMEFLTTLPPVDGDGEVLALPLVLALLAGSIGHCVSRRTRSPWAALLAPVLLLVTVIALGTLDTPLLVPQGLGFAALAVGWLGCGSRAVGGCSARGVRAGCSWASGRACWPPPCSADSSWRRCCPGSRTAAACCGPSWSRRSTSGSTRPRWPASAPSRGRI